MFQRAMTLFGGLPGAPGGGEPAAEGAESAEGEEGEERSADDEIAELRSKLEEMERQIDALAKKK